MLKATKGKATSFLRPKGPGGHVSTHPSTHQSDLPLVLLVAPDEQYYFVLTSLVKQVKLLIHLLVSQANRYMVQYQDYHKTIFFNDITTKYLKCEICVFSK